MKAEWARYWGKITGRTSPRGLAWRCPAPCSDDDIHINSAWCTLLVISVQPDQRPSRAENTLPPKMCQPLPSGSGRPHTQQRRGPAPASCRGPSSCPPAGPPAPPRPAARECPAPGPHGPSTVAAASQSGGGGSKSGHPKGPLPPPKHPRSLAGRLFELGSRTSSLTITQKIFLLSKRRRKKF